ARGILLDRELTAEHLRRARRIWLIGRPAAQSAAERVLALPDGARLGDDLLELGGASASGDAGLVCVGSRADGRPGLVIVVDALSPGALLTTGRRLEDYAGASQVLLAASGQHVRPLVARRAAARAWALSREFDAKPARPEAR
ncbi:MAG: hypothetical protein JSV80_06875, partial [Acidobacteriota bacterium]